jgi:hypothetical protein
MKRMCLILEGRLVEIYYPVYVERMYKIVWDNIEIGYLYCREGDRLVGRETWVATTPHVEVYMSELVTFLENRSL